MDANKKCPRCPEGQIVEWPPVIGDQTTWQYCMTHSTRWSIGAATESPPADGEGGAEFLRLFTAA
jgi:hypothetical protein